MFSNKFFPPQLSLINVGKGVFIHSAKNSVEVLGSILVTTTTVERTGFQVSSSCM